MADTGYSTGWNAVPRSNRVEDRRSRAVGTPEQHEIMRDAAERYHAGQLDDKGYLEIVQPIQRALYEEEFPTAIGRAWDTTTHNLSKGWNAISDAFTPIPDTPLGRDAGVYDIDTRPRNVPQDTATLSDGPTGYQQDNYDDYSLDSTQGYDETGFTGESGAQSFDETGFGDTNVSSDDTYEYADFDEKGFQEELDASNYNEAAYEDVESSDEGGYEPEGYAEGGEVEDDWEPYVEAAEPEPEPRQYAQSAVGTGTMTDESPERPADDWEPYVEPPAEPEQASPGPSMSDTGDVQPAGVEPKMPPVAAKSEDDWEPYYAEPEGAFATFGRELLHGAPPAAVGAITGAGTGAALGAAGLNPITVVGGTIGGALVGGYTAEAVKDKTLKAAGFDDDLQRAANAKANPWSAAAGTAISNVAGGAAGLGKAAVTGAARMLGAGVGGAWETGVQVYQGKPLQEAIPPIVASTAGGAAFAGGRPWTRGAEKVGANVGARFKPAPPPTPAPPVQPAAEPPAQGQFALGESPPYNPKTGAPQEAQIGGGEQQPALPLEPPTTQPRSEPQLPLEPPPTVNAEGQLGFSINAPHTDSRYAAQASRDSQPAAAGTSREAAPPAPLPKEPQPRPHSVVGRGLARDAAGEAPATASGIHVLQPGQMDPTIQHGLRQPTETLPVPARNTFEPRRTPDNSLPGGRWEPLPPSRSLVPHRSESTQGVTEPPVPGGHTRMYQGHGQPPREFSTDRAVAQRYGQVKYTDVKNDSMPFFKPGRQQGQYVTDNPNFRRRAQPVGQIQTQPPGGRRAEPAPDATSPAAPPPPAGGAPPVPRMSTPEIDAAITRATGPAPAAAPAAAARPAAPQARQATLTNKAGSRTVRVSGEPITGRDGKQYQKVTYKGKDFTVPAEQLKMKAPPKTDESRREESFKILADMEGRKKAGAGPPEYPAEPSADMSFLGREALEIAKKIEATGQPDAKSFVSGMRGAAHNNRVTPENIKFYEQRLAEYQARVGGDKPKEGYSAKNMLDPRHIKKLDALIKDRSTPEKAELSSLLDMAVRRSESLAEEINAAGWRIRDINSGDVRIPVEIRALRENLTGIGATLMRALNGIKSDNYTGNKSPKQIEARVKADLAMLRGELGSWKPENKIPQPTRGPAPPENVKYAAEAAQRGAKSVAEHAARVSERASAPIDAQLANRMLNQPAVLRAEAAKRGLRPEELKAKAEEAVKPKSVAAERKPDETISSEPLTTANAASKEFREAQQAYRAREIGDDEFIAAKTKHDEASRAFDESRGEAAPAPAKYTGRSEFTGKLDPNISHTDYVQRLQEMRDNKPRPIEKLWRNPDKAPPGAVDAHREKIKAWNREYAAVNQNQKRALERDNAAYRAKQEAKPAELPKPSDDLEIPDFLKRTPKSEAMIRPGAERVPPGTVVDRTRGPRRTGRRTEKLPIGTEQQILEKGLEKATGPKGEPRKPYMEGAERKGAKAKVKTHDDAVFTGATVHEAAVFARNAGYKQHQIFEMGGKPYTPPKAATPPVAARAAPAAATVSSGGGRTPPPGPRLAATPAPGTPTSPPGKVMEAVNAATTKLLDVGHAVQMLASPMTRGTQTSMALAKDFSNTLRRNRWEWSDIDTKIEKNHTPERRKAMWEAADAESVAQQQGKPAGKALAGLSPEERATLRDLHARGQDAWERAREIGMVEGEGLPSYTPRMLINLAKGSSTGGPTSLDPMGLNLRTTTSQLKHRKHLTTEETEAAAKLKFGDEAEVVKDIRTLPLVIAKLEDAIAGRMLVDSIKAVGKRTGTDTVAEGFKPTGGEHEWFNIDHPSLKTWRKSGDNFIQVPLYIRGDFEGPLRASLTKSHGPLYGLAMDLKSKTMSVIMNSPLIHNAVEWGRALPAMPGKVVTFKVYFEGNKAKHDPTIMREAIDGGLVPIGKRFFNQDVHALMEAPSMQVGRSWTSQVLSYVPGLFSKEAGEAVKAKIDKAGDFWHNTMLWDRVGDLQMGLYVNLRDTMVAKGVDKQTATRAAAHWANRYAGAIPHEAMSDAARKAANMLMFSRSFTLGNLGAMKDMFNGMPKDVRAQITRDVGSVDPKAEAYIKSLARRKAIAIIGLDIGLMYIGNSLLQSGINVLKGDKTLDEEGRGYAERFDHMLKRVSENPWELLQPFHLAESLSATSENEPGKQDRIRIGYTKDGQAIYLRNPAGKIGEEFVGWATAPLDMMKRKMSTTARPAWQVMANDKGFGRKVYDPNADSVGKYVKNVAKIFEHIATAQTPEIQVSGAKNLITGEGDPTLSAWQTFGPLTGVTASRGAPGGPAMGELYKAREKHQYAVNDALPEIRRLIKSEKAGDFDKAVDKMTELGIPKGLQKFYIRTTQDPSTRLTPKAAKDLYRYGTEEELKRFERAQEQQQRRQQ